MSDVRRLISNIFNPEREPEVIEPAPAKKPAAAKKQVANDKPAPEERPAKRGRKKAKVSEPEGLQATVYHKADHGINRSYMSRNAIRVVEGLQDAGYEAFVVGGCVRDALMGLRPKDFDVATSATPEQARSLFRNSRIIGRRFKLVHVVYGREIIETATFRAPSGSEEDDHHTDDAGRVLRDNVYGTLADDAVRRDFTCNALYYDPRTETVHDFVGGMNDLNSRLIRMIGDPPTRFREDPVRMLRAVRFAEKLDCDIEASSVDSIHELAPLLSDIPAARLFDEILKLLQSGLAVDTYKALKHYGLFAPLFPFSAPLLDDENSADSRLVLKAMSNTDARIQQSKPVTPAFLFAALLWPAVRNRFEQAKASGTPAVPALSQAAGSVTSDQAQHISIPKRFSLPMRDIWNLQLRFDQRRGQRPLRLLEHPKFRAAYDFMLLRVYVGDAEEELATWWTDIQEEDEATREERVKNGPAGPAGSGGAGAARRKRKPRRRKPAGGEGGNTPATDSGDKPES